MDLTERTNLQNVDTIRKEIIKKIDPDRNYIYLPSRDMVTKVVTDMDHWPYSRYYRGFYGYNEPVVMEREAGWRPVRDACYTVYTPPEKPVDPQLCFQAACSSTVPCHIRARPSLQKLSSMREDEFRNIKYTTESELPLVLKSIRHERQPIVNSDAGAGSILGSK